MQLVWFMFAVLQIKLISFVNDWFLIVNFSYDKTCPDKKSKHFNNQNYTEAKILTNWLHKKNLKQLKFYHINIFNE